jgi:hypothetical protein
MHGMPHADTHAGLHVCARSCSIVYVFSLFCVLFCFVLAPLCGCPPPLPHPSHHTPLQILLIPEGVATFSEAIRIGCETRAALEASFHEGCLSSLSHCHTRPLVSDARREDLGRLTALRTSAVAHGMEEVSPLLWSGAVLVPVTKVFVLVTEVSRRRPLVFCLQGILVQRFGVTVGRPHPRGGYCPPIATIEQAVEIMEAAVAAAGTKVRV